MFLAGQVAGEDPGCCSKWNTARQEPNTGTNKTSTPRSA